ncbi:hypothetical protein RRG08_010768 [Elysia crispata]|uniref:Uncharacterized protein n=1 Tax=Elysia crispata TaxID=231223 RepID=A0AAE1DSS6_9GAST|nr:hypothetical protein RRG08_010768 [Elysia crispata]
MEMYLLVCSAKQHPFSSRIRFNRAKWSADHHAKCRSQRRRAGDLNTSRMEREHVMNLKTYNYIGPIKQNILTRPSRMDHKRPSTIEKRSKSDWLADHKVVWRWKIRDMT